MKKIIWPVLLTLTFILISCSTPQPPVAYHGTDSTALVIRSLDDHTSQMLQPAISAKEGNDQLLTRARTLHTHETAVVILENYTELQPGGQFRTRGTDLFVGLRALGYRHIYFLQGNGVADPENLLTVVKYD